MVEIRDITLDLRNTDFVPNEFRALIICETKFDFMTDDDKCMKAAEKHFDYVTKERRLALKRALIAQKQPQTIQDKAFADFDDEIKKTRDSDIWAYAVELRACKPLGALPACVEDCTKWLAMLRKDYPFAPKNITLLASEKNFNSIVEFKLCDTESDEHK